ncbi:hypothetical protein AADW59_00870 [Candidatus Hodgkinia cicadicola]
MRHVVLYGIQPTGCPHLGNLLCLQRARSAQPLKWVCCIADLHALTSNTSTNCYYKHRINLAAAFVLSNVASSTCIIYIQSRSLAQTCLLWIISCLSRQSEIERASAAAAGANMGRVLYPSLMAADIIACRATHVVAGHDQNKHLEYTRLILGRINALARLALGTCHTLLPKTKAQYSQPIKLMSLQSPSEKMSKSDTRALSSVYILDEYTTVCEKIARAITNSRVLPTVQLAAHAKLGITNLVEMYALVSGLKSTLLLKWMGAESVERFKSLLAKLIYSKTRTTRIKTKQWLRRPETLDAVLTAGSKAIASWASSCVAHVELIINLKQRG